MTQVTMITRDQQDKMQVAMDKLFGLTHHLRFEPSRNGFKRPVVGAPLDPGDYKYGSLMEAYRAYSDDFDLQRLGQRTTQIFNNASFESALANSLNKLLMRDYAINYRWIDIVTAMTSVDNFRPAKRIRLQHVDDLYDVEEEDVYQDANITGDEQVSYSVIQKGATITITRRAMINDDVGAISRAVSQLSRAAFRTIAKRVWNKVINNDPYVADGTAMFHADHGNLGSAALSPAALTAARKAIFAQKEPGSTERLGLSGPFLLAIPIELEEVAIPINHSMIAPGTATDANPWHERFGENDERIFSNPLFSDANNWYLFDISGNVQIIEVGFLMGKQSPEIFVADAERVGQMMNQDRIVYKIRHEYEAEILDYRGGYAGIVA